MSKIGKRPITIPEGVNIEQSDNILAVSANSNKLELGIPRETKVEIKDGKILVSRVNDSKPAKEKHGLIARLIANMIEGVKDGFNKDLTFTGTGYRAAVAGNELVLNMGYSHEIKLAIPEGIEVKVVKNTITVSGINKEKVGQFAAKVREVRPPEVYKGKGIKYKEEHIRRKAGKTAASK